MFLFLPDFPAFASHFDVSGVLGVVFSTFLVLSLFLTFFVKACY